MRVSCSSCDFEAEAAEADRATAVLARVRLGELFSDVECPTCGALCFPSEPEDRWPFVAVDLPDLIASVKRLAAKPGADPDLRDLADRLPERRRRG